MAATRNLERVLARGCWTPVERFGVETAGSAARFGATAVSTSCSIGEVHGRPCSWDVPGEHNRMNALAAIAAARHAACRSRAGIEALGAFRNVKRRLEVRGMVNGITVYDDFAHHPTAIEPRSRRCAAMSAGHASSRCSNRAPTR